ncbi:MAG: CHAT domain-containing protein [Saprospiraceae bacterium]|nr:CHAT domain-containing protein [Saprospiraceae bacterium]
MKKKYYNRSMANLFLVNIYISLFAFNQSFQDSDSISFVNLRDSIFRLIEKYSKVTEAYEYLNSSEHYFIDKYGIKSNYGVQILELKGTLFMDLKQFELAHIYMDSSLHVGFTFLDSTDRLIGAAYKQKGVLESIEGNKQNAITYYNKALNIYKINPPIHPVQMSDLLGNLAIIYRDWSNFDTAQIYYDKLLEFQINTYGEYSPQASSALGFIGNNYLRSGKYDYAVLIYEKRIRIESHIANIENENMAICYNNIGLCYNYKFEYFKAIQYYNKALNIRSTLYPPDDIRLASVFNNIGLAHFNRMSFDSSLFYYQMAYNIRSKHMPPDHPELSINEANLASVYEETNHMEQAKALRIKHFERQKKQFAKDQPQLSIAYYNMAHFYNKSAIYDSALYFIDTAVNILNYNFKKEPEFYFYDHPDLVVLLLELRAECYYSIFLKSNSNDYLYKSKATLEEAFKLYEKSNKLRNLPVLDIVKSNFTFNDLMILFCKVNNKLFEITTNYSLIKESWLKAEESKNRVLYGSILKDKEIKNGDIPDTIMVQMNDILKQILALTSEVDQLIYQKTNIGNKEVIYKNLKIDSLRKQYDNILVLMSNYSPSDFNLRFNKAYPDLSYFQRHLIRDNRTVLEYVANENGLELFLINSDTLLQINLFSGNLRSLYNLLDTLNESIQLNKFRLLNPKELKLSLTNFQRTSMKLYDYLIRPIEKYLKSEIIISSIPGFNSLPFELLLSSSAENVFRFKEYKYLCSEHTISYIHSVSLFADQLRSNNASVSNKLIAFAPFYEGLDEYTWHDDKKLLRDSCKALPFSGIEALTISKLFHGEVVLGKKSTIQKFKEAAPNYNILHLSTHGYGNSNDGKYSWLGFKDTINDESYSKLYVKDIYSFNLKADLVTISACESNKGELLQSEGVLSLLRAFIFAGAKSIVSTIWKVDDKQTSELMILFYKYLSKGTSKNLALAYAKNEYRIKHINDGFAHPFYWSAFVLNGNINPISFK